MLTFARFRLWLVLPALLCAATAGAKEGPAEVNPYLYARMLRARAFEAVGDMPEARGLYLDALQMPNLSPEVRATIHARLARTFEQSPDSPAKRAVYLQLEQEPTFGPVQDALLRKVYLALEAAQTEEAIRIVQLLAGQPEAAINGAEYAGQIRLLVALVKDPEQARSYWRKTGTWWPAWEKLEAQLGANSPREKRLVPGDSAALWQEMRSLTRPEDGHDFVENLRDLAHAARWSPTAAADFEEALALLPRHAPTLADAIHELALSVRSQAPDLHRPEERSKPDSGAANASPEGP